ncbi:M56 family metallopeptidase [Neotamlana nanhaiensis]|uniref:M56 family metallopeptidase n=1 Tax=Neotamlana nanhaiensis TaxID=1382798 RepID=UPI00069A2466|nr:M56 family metallopeptidase [Tamlana nanhaiensis]
MLIYLIKSSACLAILMLFYKLCLEKTSAHHFKRFYLLAIVLVSVAIPFITFTSYVEVENTFTQPYIETDLSIIIHEPTFWEAYSPKLFWGIYLLGVAVFMVRFIKNLFDIFETIKANPKYKNASFINVLVMDLLHPHTFFNYIFINRNKFENHQIPTEVLLHEQTHAKQKHGIDILFIELLQIIFWFNPILYLLKKDIKLNHEFLADQSVINQGYNTKHYQQLLLAYSSHAADTPLANAINYSLIKKRFTVMKTKTSKVNLWIRGLIVFPLLAMLIYSFSDKIVLPQPNQSETPNHLFKSDSLNRTPTCFITIIDDETISLNGKKYSLQNFDNHLKNFLKPLPPEQKEKLTSFIVHGPNDNKTLKTVNIILRKHNLLKINTKQEVNTTQQKATPEQIAQYNKLVKKFNSLPAGSRIITIKDKNRLEEIYNLMTFEQKRNSEIFPNFNTVMPVPVNPNQEKATPEQISEYNKLATKYNNLTVEKRIYKMKDVVHIKYLYSLMNKAQKANAKPFPYFPPPPPKSE